MLYSKSLICIQYVFKNNTVIAVSLGADFSGLILEGPFNNFVEAASRHPLSAVCCS